MGPTGPVLVTARSGTEPAGIVVSNAIVLFPLFGSGVGDEAEKLFVSEVPGGRLLARRTVKVPTRLAPTGTSPMVQVVGRLTSPGVPKVHRKPVVLTGVVPSGRISVR